MKHLIGLIACIALFSSFTPAPQFSKTTDIVQGFNFRTDKMTAVGYITSLQIGSTVIAADLSAIKDPTNPAALLSPVVGVTGNLTWGTGINDGIYISAQISTANKTKIASLLMSTDPSITQVKIGVALYEYDPVAKKYYKSFYHTTSTLSAVLEKNGNDLNLAVADNASNTVQSPVNYTLQLGIRPQAGLPQTIVLGTGVGKTVTKPWGQ